MIEQSLFFVFASLIIFSSLMVVIAKNPVTSAIFLVADLLLIAGLYATLDAHFVSVVQVLLYAGAIVVLFLFIIMIINVDLTRLRPKRGNVFDAFGLFLIILSFTFLVAYISIKTISIPQLYAPLESFGSTREIAKLLFTKYLWPFEITSLIILLVTVLCVIVVKKAQKPIVKKESFHRT